MTTMFVIVAAPPRFRMTTRSITMPMIGASTSSTAANASGAGPVMLDPKVPIREGRDHRDRAVREVEDARRRVRDDEPARRDEVDARDREAEDRVAQELADHPNPGGSVSYVLVICIELPGAQSKPYVPSVGDFGQ